MNENINPLEIFFLLARRKKLNQDLTREQLYNEIFHIENSLNFVKSTIYDNPFFPVAPTTIDKGEFWIAKTDIYKTLDKTKRELLFKNGFTILNRKLLEQKSIVDIFETLKVDTEDIILDKDYGLLIFPDGALKKNFYLAISELTRYGETYPMLQSQISNIFSIGAIRAHSLLNNKIDFTPIEITINKREELDEFISTINEKLHESKSRFKVWFRGQNSEHFLKKIDDTLIPHTPWRTILDSSLIPSLFRNSENTVEDLEAYTCKLSEILEFETALNVNLNVPRFELRNKAEEQIKDYFKNSVWEDSNSPFTVTSVTNDDISEFHDYNPIYRALQISLFLQHYGIPTNILDITKDIDVALFFAQMKNNNGVYEKIETVENSVIYIFILDPKTDRFIDSSELLEEFGVQRPLRQKCGVIAGASFAHQNYYSRFISVRIKLSDFINFNEHMSCDYLFPNKEDDNVISFLTEYGEKNNFKHVKAF
jgi:FRG domain